MKKKKPNKNLPAVLPPNKVAPIEMDNISPIVQLAMRGDIDVAKLDKLIDVQSKYEEIQSKKEFYKAFSEFKRSAPMISKDSNVSYGQTSYSHASLGNIMEICSPLLADQGLAVSWLTNQKDSQVHVTAVLSHVLGHSVSNTLSAPPDDSGKKNNIQSVASTVTYLQRYTTLALLGLATKDDDDGRGSTPQELDYISADQVESLQFEISKKENWDPVELTKAICTTYKIPSLQHVLLAKYDEIYKRISETK